MLYIHETFYYVIKYVIKTAVFIWEVHEVRNENDFWPLIQWVEINEGVNPNGDNAAAKNTFILLPVLFLSSTH